MVNVDFASPSLVLGAVLIGCGVMLLQMRNLQTKVSRDADIVVAAMISIVGSTLIFQGWRLDPLLLLCQALTTSVAVWYGIETFRLRSKDDDDTPNGGMLPPPGMSTDANNQSSAAPGYWQPPMQAMQAPTQPGAQWQPPAQGPGTYTGYGTGMPAGSPMQPATAPPPAGASSVQDLFRGFLRVGEPGATAAPQSSMQVPGGQAAYLPPQQQGLYLPPAQDQAYPWNAANAPNQQQLAWADTQPVQQQAWLPQQQQQFQVQPQQPPQWDQAMQQQQQQQRWDDQQWPASQSWEQQPQQLQPVDSRQQVSLSVALGLPLTEQQAGLQALPPASDGPQLAYQPTQLLQGQQAWQQQPVPQPQAWTSSAPAGPWGYGQPMPQAAEQFSAQPELRPSWAGGMSAGGYEAVPELPPRTAQLAVGVWAQELRMADTAAQQYAGDGSYIYQQLPGQVRGDAAAMQSGINNDQAQAPVTWPDTAAGPAAAGPDNIHHGVRQQQGLAGVQSRPPAQPGWAAPARVPGPMSTRVLEHIDDWE